MPMERERERERERESVLSLDINIIIMAMKTLCIYYWPSARSRWLDIGRVLFLRFYEPRRSRGPWKRKKRTRPISSHLDRTSLVNKRFIVWHKERWKKWSLYLFIFEHWKGTQLNAKVIAPAPISWLDKCRRLRWRLTPTAGKTPPQTATTGDSR